MRQTGPMPASDHRLTTAEMAAFVHDGFLRFDALIPEPLNQKVMAQLPDMEQAKFQAFLGGAASEALPATGTVYEQCHAGTALGDVLALPEVRGIVRSLVGQNPTFDHDFVHHLPAKHQYRQHLHPDAIVDTEDHAFDIQLFYYPHTVAPGGGGTRFVPGTHLRRAPSASTARFQHVAGERRFAGPAGTVLVFHHGLWHAGDANPSDQDRWMYKLRLNPTEPQMRLWNTADLEQVQNDPADHIFARWRTDSVAATLRQQHPWQGTDAQRYDLVQRTRLWRFLTDDPAFDADHYLTRTDRPLAADAPGPATQSDNP